MSSQHMSSNADSAIVRPTCMAPPTDQAAKPEEWFDQEVINSLGGGAKPSSKAVTDAMWALRDHMIKDSMKLGNYLDTFD